jgi:heme/copper-type cytochrome/quinol oxidase subunit 2
MRLGVKLALVCLAVAVAGVLIGFYASSLTTLSGSPAYSVPVQEVSGQKVVDLKIETVAAVGPQLSRNPDWVSYLIQNTKGEWKRETVWDLPANATVHVTIYNFDGASGLRNPYLGRPQGMVGDRILVDGKPVNAVDPNDASHTFAVPQLGLILAIPGVGDNAKNQCGYAPCPLSNAHRTIQFTFRTPAKPGTFRWQCFVPCAAGWIDGFGGPMQTIGYMDGYLNVKA